MIYTIALSKKVREKEIEVIAGDLYIDVGNNPENYVD